MESTAIPVADVIGAAGHLIIHGNGGPKIAAQAGHGTFEYPRCDTNNGVREPIDFDNLAQHFRIPAKTAAPQGFVDYQDRIAPGL